MHRQDIKAAICKKFGSLKALARTKGVSDALVSEALARPQRAGETVIIEALGINPHKIWPDRYDIAGKRTIARAYRQHFGDFTTKKSPNHSSKSVAAGEARQ